MSRCLLFFSAILSVVNASQRNLFQWKFGSRVLTCSLPALDISARQWVRDAAFDRTLFGLDTKILLPYLSMQYNHNALDKYIYIYIYLYVICICIISIPMHRGVRVFTLEIEQVQRSTDRINWTTCIFVTNSSTKSWWTTAMIQAEIMIILSNPVLNSVSPDHLPLLVAIALQNSEGSFNFNVLKCIWSLQTRQEVIQLSWKGNKLCLFIWSSTILFASS